jgi:hypothetical protein
LDAINAPLAKGVGDKPDQQEIALHAYAIIGKDSQDLKNTVYDDTILITLYNSEEPLDREVLIKKSISLLQMKLSSKWA